MIEKKKPKVSIVTVTYNDSENLKETLSSLLEQDYEDIESIIVDGGSTDNSVELIKEFEHKFKGTVKWVSEKDKGLYNAANKGIKMATGEIVGCYWDKYADSSVISEIVATMEREESDGCHGDLIFFDQGKPIRYWKMKSGTIQNGWMPAHPTLYLKREVYEKYGLYNESYKCAGDYEFMVRSLGRGEVKLSYIPKVLIHMFYGGVSTSGFKAYKRSILESVRALKENNIKLPWIVIIKRIIKTTVQFINK